MGYTTDFNGSFELNKPLTPSLHTFLKNLAGTRRMGRNVDTKKYGFDGEFYCEETQNFGQTKSSNIKDYNQPPVTQPGLWLGWIPNEEGTSIVWDGGEKFYHYIEWLYYLIEKVLNPNGYKLNGEVMWQGEEIGDMGKIIVKDNVISIIEAFGSQKQYIPEKNIHLEYVYIDIESVNPEAKKADKEKVLTEKIKVLTEIVSTYLSPALVEKILQEVEERVK